MDQTIVIKPANKGGGVVILDKENYNKEMHRLLDDPETHVRLCINLTIRYQNELEIMLKKAKKKR